MLEAYLDIETTGLSATGGEITVIGVHLTDGNSERFVQLIGEEITAGALLAVMEDVEVIYTYNGSRFDLPFIRACLGVDLRERRRHRDLMYDCWRRGLYGGFKAVEARLGICREIKNVSGYDAVILWWKYRNHGSAEALALLLGYNREDVLNLRLLRERLPPGPICSHKPTKEP